MTTYIYRIVLDDSECIMMDEALEMMITYCEKKLLEEPGPPYYAWLRSAKAVKGRLNSDTEQMSGNNFNLQRKDPSKM